MHVVKIEQQRQKRDPNGPTGFVSKLHTSEGNWYCSAPPFNRKIKKRIKKERRHTERDQRGEENKTPALGCPGPIGQRLNIEGHPFCSSFPALGLIFSFLVQTSYHARSILLDPSRNGLEHFQGLGWSQSHPAGIAHSLVPFLCFQCSVLRRLHGPKQGSWFQDKWDTSAWPFLQTDPAFSSQILF